MRKVEREKEMEKSLRDRKKIHISCLNIFTEDCKLRILKIIVRFNKNNRFIDKVRNNIISF